MSDAAAEAIRAFAEEFEGVLSDEAILDVRDWCEHGEWLLAVEVLGEKLFDEGVRLNDDQRRTFVTLLTGCGGDESGFAPLLRDPPIE